MIFARVEERRTEYPVAMMCRVSGVSRSGFSARPGRPVGAAAARRAESVARIGEVHAEVRARYGSPRVHAESNARGVAWCGNAVAKLMRANGIRAASARRSVRTTDSRHGRPVAGTVLARDFAPAGLGDGLHGRADARGVAVPGGRGKPVRPADRGAGGGRDDDEPAGHGRAGRGRRASASAAGTGGGLGPGEPVRR